MRILPINTVQNKTIQQRYSTPSFKMTTPNLANLSEVNKQLAPYLSGKVKYTEENAHKFVNYLYDNSITLQGRERDFVSLLGISNISNLKFNTNSKDAKCFLNHFLIKLLPKYTERVGSIILGTNLYDKFEKLFELLPNCFLQDSENENLDIWIKRLTSSYSYRKELSTKCELQMLYDFAVQTKNYFMLNSLNTRLSLDDMIAVVGWEKSNDEEYLYRFLTPAEKYEKQKKEGKKLIKNIDLTSIDDFDKLLSNDYMQSDGAQVFRDNPRILLAIPDLIKTEDNAEQYDNVLKSLRKIKLVNYNVKDEFNITFLEKVLNSENSDLLDVIKDESFSHCLELDWAYNRIDNEEFKSKVKKMNILYPNVEKSIKLRSTKALSILEENIASPFFCNEENLNNIIERLAETTPTYYAFFCASFKKYLPSYFEQMFDLHLEQSNKQNKISWFN